MMSQPQRQTGVRRKIFTYSLEDVKLVEPENGQVFAIAQWEYKRPAGVWKCKQNWSWYIYFCD